MTHKDERVLSVKELARVEGEGPCTCGRAVPG
jgi:hypothetical protein